MMNLISSKQFIGRLMTDLNLDGSEFVDNIYQWIEDAIEIMEVPKYYIYRKQRKLVKNGRVLMPTSIHFLVAVLTSDKCTVSEDYEKPDYIYELRRLIMRNNALIGSGVKIPIIFNQYGTINSNYINTTFDTGSVLFVYKGLPIDCDGYPMVPKAAKCTEALQYFMIYKLGLAGFKHPEITWREALALWTQYYPAAGNLLSWPTLQEYQEFTELWTNPLLGDLSTTTEII